MKMVSCKVMTIEHQKEYMWHKEALKAPRGCQGLLGGIEGIRGCRGVRGVLGGWQGL